MKKNKTQDEFRIEVQIQKNGIKKFYPQVKRSGLEHWEYITEEGENNYTISSYACKTEAVARNLMAKYRLNQLKKCERENVKTYILSESTM